jgi:hypothetical protein
MYVDSERIAERADRRPDPGLSRRREPHPASPTRPAGHARRLSHHPERVAAERSAPSASSADEIRIEWVSPKIARRYKAQAPFDIGEGGW